MNQIAPNSGNVAIHKVHISLEVFPSFFSFYVTVPLSVALTHTKKRSPLHETY